MQVKKLFSFWQLSKSHRTWQEQARVIFHHKMWLLTKNFLKNLKDKESYFLTVTTIKMESPLRIIGIKAKYPETLLEFEKKKKCKCS